MPRLDRANILAAIEGSLRRLRTERIDLYYLHWPDRYAPGFGSHQFDVEQVRDAVPFEETVAVRPRCGPAVALPDVPAVTQW